MINEKKKNERRKENKGNSKDVEIFSSIISLKKLDFGLKSSFDHVAKVYKNSFVSDFSFSTPCLANYGSYKCL